MSYGYFSKYDGEVVRVFQIREHHAQIVKLGRYVVLAALLLSVNSSLQKVESLEKRNKMRDFCPASVFTFKVKDFSACLGSFTFVSEFFSLQS